MVLPTSDITRKLYVRQKVDEIISISNCFRCSVAFLTLNCSLNKTEIECYFLPYQKASKKVKHFKRKLLMSRLI